MKVKAGDKIECLAISWINPSWEFDYSTLLLSPIIQYSPNDTHVEMMIEDFCISLCCDDKVENEDVKDSLEWVGVSLNWLKRVVRERSQGKDTWKTRVRHIVKQEIEFYNDEFQDLAFKVIKTTEI